MMRDYLHRMAGQYLDTADWTDEERLGEEADELGVDIIGWHADAIAEAGKTCREFLDMIVSDDDERDIEAVLEGAGIGPEQAGHDLWLTRNGHGTGFWDRGHADDVAKILTNAAHSMGSSYVYIGNDGWQYLT